ncbi:hypothetical protein DPM19_01870 [Actinomadura craniellae]|uniref:DUF4286 domain-containing protein n=1 Tax=Actinomadura craniellae TaxID=2231787 RepID=A0A365HDE3_9ACTN|nr:DUF4286 family protein [Actinomadura craniellae]RAY16936.1 hypothetical protein DPM19_01870 [Actinomadura craniellae]
MPRGILYVESRPSSPEQLADFHRWYDETHVQEIVAVDGFVSARRFAPLGDDGPFIAIYEIEADDVETAQAKLAEATKAGGISAPVGVQLDPPPTIRFYREITAYTP